MHLEGPTSRKQPSEDALRSEQGVSYALKEEQEIANALSKANKDLLMGYGHEEEGDINALP